MRARNNNTANWLALHLKSGWPIMRPICAVFGSLALLSVATSAAQAEGRDRAGSLDWQTFKVPEYGTRVEYPAGIFAAVGEAEKGVGQRFESDDGHAVLSVYARENEDGDTPTSYLRKNLRQPARDYERVTRSFFAISMERDGTIYYSRCNFSHCRRFHTLLRLGVSAGGKAGLGSCGDPHQSLTPAARTMKPYSECWHLS